MATVSVTGSAFSMRCNLARIFGGPAVRILHEPITVQYNGTPQFLAGILSKSSGFVLRVAAVIHATFHLDNPCEMPKEISTEALEAAQDFVDMCGQHAAFMAGRGDIADTIQQLHKGLVDPSTHMHVQS